ncbi:MAG: hypothetical protein RDV48_26015 [Candidatus Eremiobacteraeota bacterium]|nr:hypothetical protein [Candidatus Eremiobacteraeota bacterium]
MKSLRLDALMPSSLKTSLSLGFFDGVHLGHQKILARTVDDGRRRGTKSAVFTFRSHPLTVISPENTPLLLSSFEERQSLMEALGLDYFIWTDFDAAFGSIAHEVFVTEILVGKLGAKAIFIGPNYRFGRAKGGDGESLSLMGRSLGFEVHTVSPVSLAADMISSTLVRNTLLAGQMGKVQEMLGRFYSLQIKGEHFESLPGGTLVKCTLPKERAAPRKGIYAGTVFDGTREVPAAIMVHSPPALGEQTLSLVPLSALSAGAAPLRTTFLEYMRMGEGEKNESLRENDIKTAADIVRGFKQLQA